MPSSGYLVLHGVNPNLSLLRPYEFGEKFEEACLIRI